MTKDKALFAWFDRFAAANDLGCYVSTSVPTDVVLPYLTYEYNSADMGDNQVPIVVNIWARTSSEVFMNELAESFKKYVENNDSIVCDEGVIYVYKGSPWSLSQNAETDRYIKLRYINLTLDFCTI